MRHNSALTTFRTESEFDLGLGRSTHFSAFNIYVPYKSCRLGVGGTAEVPAPDFDRFLDGASEIGNLATITGPFGVGDEQFVPVGQPLPYSIEFSNDAGASSTVSEVRVISELDDAIDLRSFELGDIQLGDLDVHMPSGRSSFQGDFDFSQSRGFVLRVSAGLDVSTATVSWLLQAIDPLTGELLQDPGQGLLPPNNSQGIGAGFVGYSVQPLTDVASGGTIAAQARVLFDTAPPQDTLQITHTLDAVAPTSSVSVQPLSSGEMLLVQWQAVDDAGGSGVQHVTVYVAEDGGDFRIWQRQTTETEAVFAGEPGLSYEFLVVATDQAGNQQSADIGRAVPDDGSTVNLGGLSRVGETTAQDLGEPPVATGIATHPLFVAAALQIPAAIPTRARSEFTTVLRPFTAQAFATNIPASHAGIGPMAIAVQEDNSVLASGGPSRNQIFAFSVEGGRAGSPLYTLAHPAFDMLLDGAGSLWVATGGGPLLQVDAVSGETINEYGTGITQSLALSPTGDKIYVSSRNGVELFDPQTETFSHFSDVRVGNLRFAPDGTLWAAAWPQRGKVVRFNGRGDAEVMLSFETPVDSLAFGLPETDLAGLLFVSHNAGDRINEGGKLSLVDLATLHTTTIANGGTRGDILTTDKNGRVLLSQSNQIDVLLPVIAPQVAFTNPSADAIVPLPLGQITVTFDIPMTADDVTGLASVTNPDNYLLLNGVGNPIDITSVVYDNATNTSILFFDALMPQTHELTVRSTVESDLGQAMLDDYTIEFTTIDQFNDLVDISFANARSDRSTETISYDVTITNIADQNLVIPLLLVLDARQGYRGAPQTAAQDQVSSAWLLDLSENLGDGILEPGESTTARHLIDQQP